MTKTPNKNGRKTDGTFALGNALGGRTKGSRNGTTLAVEALLDGQSKALTQRAIDTALDGDGAALRLCLERICPPRKDRPVLFDLPAMTNSKDAASAMAGIIMAVADGDMTPDEAGSVTCIIEQYRRTLETTELEGRLQALEQATSKGN
ncbi:hypothetical protein OAA86_10190 [Rhodospirillales bacterium]|nr:hypothetical protein [Rhodospirillales bacterium]